MVSAPWNKPRRRSVGGRSLVTRDHLAQHLRAAAFCAPVTLGMVPKGIEQRLQLAPTVLAGGFLHDPLLVVPWGAESVARIGRAREQVAAGAGRVGLGGEEAG